MTELGSFGSAELPYICNDQCTFEINPEGGCFDETEGGEVTTGSCVGSCGLINVPLPGGGTCSCAPKCELSGTCCPDACLECGFCPIDEEEEEQEPIEEALEELK